MHPGHEALANASLPRDWIFTFGYDHVHPVTRESLRNMYVVIYDTYEVARVRMYEMFGNQWSMVYPTKEAARVARYKMQELDLSSLSPDPTLD